MLTGCRKWMIGILMLIALLGISACSNGDNQTVESNAQSEDGNTGAEETTGAFPRALEDANGTFVIEQKPERVAVIHWGFTDSFLLFDVPYAGLALPFTEKRSVLSTESYQPYLDKIEELVIVGENEQVNMEALLAFAPDLIIAGNAINHNLEIEILEQIAPTFMVDEEQYNVWDDWPSLVTLFGEILGQEELADRYIADFNQKTIEAREKLAQMDEEVMFVQVREKVVWVQGVNHLQLYYEEMGLTAPDLEIMEEGGQVSLEGLSELDPEHLFLGYFNVNVEDDSTLVVTDEWRDTSIWKNFRAVQSGQIYELNGELALGYGPIGQSYGIDEVVKALER